MPDKDEAFKIILRDAREAKKLLPSVYQAIGTTAAVYRRCKYGTKNWKKWDQVLTDLNNQGAELGAKITLALQIAEERI